MSDPIHIISLGAGVQSSTMALMAKHGEITPMPTGAIFADTQAEPQSVYRWLDWLEKQLPFQVHRVTAGNIGEDFLAALRDPNGRCGQPPFFVKSRKDASCGVLWRKCTSEYKLSPIRRKTRQLMKELGTKSVIQWIGISLDEAHRMKASGVRYISNVYPLVDRRITRRRCIEWMKSNGYGEPPKSACIFCPYHNDGLWRRMKSDDPEEFERAVKFERAVTEQQTKLNGAKIFGDVFLHRSCIPLDQVDFSTEEERGQLDMFGNECEGMCGV